MEKISVIMPIYNCEKYLKRSIESVLNQTYKKLELILINDGSTDNSLKVCREYERKDDRVQVIDKKKWWCFIWQKCRLENCNRGVCNVCRCR